MNPAICAPARFTSAKATNFAFFSRSVFPILSAGFIPVSPSYLASALAARYRKEHSVASLCVAGGLFLNVFLVRALETRGAFKNVYVQPVAGNSGAALGAALLARKSLGRPARQSLPHLYLGPGFSSSEIKSVIDNCKVIYKYTSGEV